MTMSLPEIWGAFSSLITSAIAVITLISGGWLAIGRPIKKRFDDDHRDRIKREECVDKKIAALQDGIDEIKTSAVSIADLSKLMSDHQVILKEHGEAIAYLRGHAEAHKEIAQAASAAATLAHDLVHPEEASPS